MRPIPPFRLIADPLTDEAADLPRFRWAAPEIGTRHQLGGEPSFLQAAGYPTCPDCRTAMSFYGQLDSINDEFVPSVPIGVGSRNTARMPITNPWLTGPAPDGVLPRAALEDRILNLLSSQNMAVIATTQPDGSPAATPVRYYSLGFEVMYTSWNESPKSRNLRRDPRVSAGIFAPLVGQASSRGAQLFGQARTLERDDPRAEQYWEAFRWQSDHVERGRSLSEPPADPLTVVTPTRIVYTEHWLRRAGFRPRQIWRADCT